VSVDTQAPTDPGWVGVRAVAWVLDDAPAPTDLLPTLVAIARRCDEDGKGSYQSVPTIAKKTGKSPEQVQRDIKRLLADGFIRLGDQTLPEKRGVPAGKRPTVYDVALEKRGPKPVKGSKNPTGKKKDDATPRFHATPGIHAGGGMEAPSTPRMDARSWGGMDATQTKPLNNPMNKPSLSGAGRLSVPSPRVPERERDESVSQKPEPTSIARKVLAKRGLTDDEIDFALGHIESQNAINGDGWWITADRNGTLDTWVASAREAMERGTVSGGPPCRRCNGTGKHPSTNEMFRGVDVDCECRWQAVDRKPRSSERCTKHPSYPASKCGLCRSERNGTRNGSPRVHVDPPERSRGIVGAVASELLAAHGINRDQEGPA
jgi:hypothetical protein